jgi:broad specificity phosphatase PhoE
MRLFLLRHGQTTGDVEDRYGGDYEDHLTEVGSEQARVLVARLREENIDKVFSSPRTRATETAQILHEELHVEVEILDGLREHNRYGILTGMTKHDAKKQYPKLVAALANKTLTIQGAESYDALKERVLAAMHHIFACKLERVAVVAHAGVIGCVYRELVLGQEITMGDCSYLELEGEFESLEMVHSEGVTFRELDIVPLRDDSQEE